MANCHIDRIVSRFREAIEAQKVAIVKHDLARLLIATAVSPLVIIVAFPSADFVSSALYCSHCKFELTSSMIVTIGLVAYGYILVVILGWPSLAILRALRVANLITAGLAGVLSVAVSPFVAQGIWMFADAIRDPSSTGADIGNLYDMFSDPPFLLLPIDLYVIGAIVGMIFWLIARPEATSRAATTR